MTVRIVAGNYAVVSGFVPKDAEVKTTQSGKSVCHFSVKSSETVNADGTRTAKWLSCVAWGRACDVARYLVKGDTAMTAGELKERTYTTRDGEERRVIELICDYVAIMQPPHPEVPFAAVSLPEPLSGGGVAATFGTEPEEIISDDDLPF